MNHLAGLLAGVTVILGTAGFVASQTRKGENADYHQEEPGMSGKEKNVKAIQDLFSAIERRDLSRQLELVQPDVELHWPPSLPYGGISRGLRRDGPGWGATWIPLQPTEAERRMDPRVVAAAGEEVVVLWHQRGLSSSGDRLDVEVLGLYRFRDGKLSRAQMFYFDTPAVLSFLAKANSKSAGSKP